MPNSQSVSLAISRWREDLERASGRDSLVNFSDLSEETLDLAHAHPSGLAQFLAGRSTRLSNLFRQPAALDLSRSRARTIRVISEQLHDRHGVHTAHLVSGVARWTATDPETGEPTRFKAPILLHPVTIRVYGPDRLDEELHMHDSPRVNPSLIRLLAEQGVHVDPQDLQNLAQGTHGFNPRPAYSHLRDRARGVAEFSVIDRTVVGIFFDVLPALLDAFTTSRGAISTHPVLKHVAAEVGRNEHHLAPEEPANLELDLLPPVPEAELVVPLDDDQRRVVAAAAAGHSVRVLSGPGTGATQTMTQVIFNACDKGQKVLFVSPRPREIVDLSRSLQRLGAAHLLADPGVVCPDIIDLADQERQLAEDDGSPAAVQSSDEVLFALMDQRHGIHQVVAPWQVSVQDALAELTVLTRSAHPPVNTVTLPLAVITELGPENREHIRGLLTELGAQQGFSPVARQSPWWLAECADSESAHTAIGAAKRLASGTLRLFINSVQEMAAEAGLTEPKTLAQCRHIVDLLHSVSNTLTVFVDELYQRPIDAMVAATATSNWRAERGISMSMSERRKMRKQARTFTRTKVTSARMHDLLVEAAKERQLWQQHAQSGGWPHAIGKVSDTRALGFEVYADIDILVGVLHSTPHGGELYDAPLESLVSRLRGLAHDPALATLPDRITLASQIAAYGLGPFLRDIHQREVSDETVVNEFEVCWWSSVLAALTETLDLTHSAGELMCAWAQRRTAEHAARRAEILATSAAENAVCTAVTPLRMPELTSGQTFDLVIVAGAHSCAVPEGVLAMARGSQSIVFGDPDGVVPRGLDESIESAALRPALLAATATAMPTIELGFQHRMPKQLSDFMVRPSPWSVAAVNPGVSLTPVHVRASQRVNHTSLDIVEAEVKTVVAAVLDHARHRSHESLAVITVTRQHARHIAEAVRDELRFDTPLLEWFGTEQYERFLVTDMHRSEDLVRDRVLLSVGLCPSMDLPLEKLLLEVDQPGAEQAVATAFTRARTHLDVISCVSADDIIELAPPTPFNVVLSRALRTAADPVSGPESLSGGMPPLVSELAAELGHRGYDAISTGGSHGWPDLAVSRAQGNLVGVLTDTRWSEPRTDSCGNSNVIIDDLHVMEHLERFGWQVVPATSLEIHCDENAVVTQVTDKVAARTSSVVLPKVVALPADVPAQADS